MRSAEAGLAGDASLAGDEERASGLNRLLSLFEGGLAADSGFGASDDELQYRDRAVAALTRYHERHLRSESSPVWLERSFNFRIGPHQLRGRVDRVDRTAEGGYELIDYKTGERRSSVAPSGDVQIALYRLGAREAWQIEAQSGSYWYVLDDERVPVPSQPDDAERVERTVLEVGGGNRGPGLRAPPLAPGLLVVRLPADLPGERGLGGAVRVARAVPRWRRKRWKSWAIASPVGTSSPAASESSCSASSRSTSSRISGFASTARSTWRSKRSIASSSSEASTATPVSPSRRRSSARAAFGLGTAAT